MRKNFKPSYGMRGKLHSIETRKKMSDKKKGEKNNFWKGGISPLVKRIRMCFLSRQWRSDVFTRDDFTCQICNIRGRQLEADHYPKRFANLFRESGIKTIEEALKYEEFWNINNGRTLCVQCHKKTETYGNKK